jgi:single-stranded-DNA-specific exonuclease
VPEAFDSQSPPAADPKTAVCDTFRAALAGFRRDGPVLVMGHNDVDGLSATAILVRALRGGGWIATPRILGRGENPWSAEMAAELAGGPRLGGIVATDLGTRPGAIKLGTPTVIVDHHVPAGTPEDATVITGHAFDPIPTSSLLAYWCAGAAVAEPAPLLWLAALGLIGDMAEKAGFPEMEAARRAYGITTLRDAVTLLNAPRRSASGDAGPALALLLKASGPKEITSGQRPETEALRAAREEVKAALEAAKRIGPKLRNGVALIRFHSACQIHPLVAQTWRGRFKDNIVLAANTGYRPGWVHFAARTAARDLDLIRFLSEHAPPGADENYGSGHRQATGGALRPGDWNHFIAGLGFGPEEQVQAE